MKFSATAARFLTALKFSDNLSPLMHWRGVGMWYETSTTAGFVHAGAANGEMPF